MLRKKLWYTGFSFAEPQGIGAGRTPGSDSAKRIRIKPIGFEIRSECTVVYTGNLPEIECLSHW